MINSLLPHPIAVALYKQSLENAVNRTLELGTVFGRVLYGKWLLYNVLLYPPPNFFVIK